MSSPKNKFQLIIGGGLRFSVSEENGISLEVLKPDFSVPTNSKNDRIYLKASPAKVSSGLTPSKTIQKNTSDQDTSVKGSLLDIYC